jgi:dephospho-CoA kinase
MRLVANGLRAEYGSSYVAEKLYEQAVAEGGNAVIESLRSTGEIIALRSKPQSFFLLAVDAESHTRYERITKRQSSTDHISYEKFLDDESREMADTSPGGMNIAECMKLADARVQNDSDINFLHDQVDNILAPLLKQ